MNDPDSLITAEQAADYLHLTVDSVRAMIKKGVLPAYKFGNTPKRPVYRIRKSALDTVLTPVKAASNG